MIRYLLVVVTHGASPHLRGVLDAFRRHMTPRPVHGLVWVDGPDVDDAAFDAIAGHGIDDWTFDGSATQRGFCSTYVDAWQEAVAVARAQGCDYVFWLEADFVVQRLVDVAAVAALLESEPELAQVALMRNAVNDAEVAAGGLYESRPGEYEPRSFTFTQEPVVHGARLRAYPWLRHRSYFTTNPNLMRVAFMEDQPWPPHPSACEGLFTHDLLADGYDFAVWGDGSVWADHVGTRTGFGY